jgi:hypothetical protein|tara:strand:- start:4935 stop:5162 length:228 start_codon:yes stop_codon:yes gene_type:complete
MVNQIDKNNIEAELMVNDENSTCAFVKKEIQQNDHFSTDIFSVYCSDGTLLAAFDSREAAIAAILQSGLRYMSLH